MGLNETDITKKLDAVNPDANAYRTGAMFDDSE